ncbi:hypothetical protein DXA74_03215 [Bacteroides sp. OF04-15BH]|nr:hypothetical protein DXA74_03215 [Bacteroides sp. OF04-15BH]
MGSFDKIIEKILQKHQEHFSTLKISLPKNKTDYLRICFHKDKFYSKLNILKKNRLCQNSFFEKINFMSLKD